MSFLSGYFEYVYLTILFIIVHELGHYLASKLLKIKVKNITIYMFGGVTNLSEGLNLNIKKEILMLLSGPIFQILFFFIIYILHTNYLVNEITYNKVCAINKLLLFFNLLPILPLDGGKLVNNILDLILPFDLSHMLSIIISIMSLPLILFIDNKLFILILIVFLMTHIIEEIKIHKYRLTYLLLERKMNNICFKKTIYIKNIKDIKRNCNYIIKKDILL